MHYEIFAKIQMKILARFYKALETFSFRFKNCEVMKFIFLLKKKSCLKLQLVYVVYIIFCINFYNFLFLPVDFINFVFTGLQSCFTLDLRQKMVPRYIIFRVLVFSDFLILVYLNVDVFK